MNEFEALKDFECKDWLNEKGLRNLVRHLKGEVQDYTERIKDVTKIQGFCGGDLKEKNKIKNKIIAERKANMDRAIEESKRIRDKVRPKLKANNMLFDTPERGRS